MKKGVFYIVVCFLSMIQFYMSAQEVKTFNYQGEVDLMYSFGIDDETNNVNLEFVNGIRFSRYLFAGVGGGLTMNFGDEAVIVPLYLNVKGYMPVSRKLDLVAGLNLGTKLDYYYDTSGGLLLRPEFGFHFPFRGKSGMDVSIFYEYYSYTVYVLNATIKGKTNQIGFKIGFHF